MRFTKQQTMDAFRRGLAQQGQLNRLTLWTILAVGISIGSAGVLAYQWMVHYFAR